MNGSKCAACGLVGFAVDATCRRCGAPLLRGSLIDEASPVQTEKERSVGQRVLWVFGMTLALLFVYFVSLLATSEGLDYDERQTVVKTTAILEQAGFSKEAFLLGNLVRYRGTDSWWNELVGHESAWAATNFPFQVVTLYPPFFDLAVDDTERAAILLHESYHLFGFGEKAALQGVWLEKQRLGWTADQYSKTRVWRNTREWTVGRVPALFTCGTDGRSDCFE